MEAARTRLEGLLGAVAEAPAALVAGLGLATIVAITPSNGGHDPSAWYPGALFLLGLLAVAMLALPRARRPSRGVVVACAALAAYAAWSYLSITWADQKGEAWDGANRTAMYAVVFALFAFWPLRGRAAAVLVGAFALAVAVIGLVELIGVASAAHPGSYFIDGRFARPAGYANANAALWSFAFWPCVVLGARREVGPAARGLFVGAAVLLGGLALLGQSRGWLFALPIVAIVFVALAPRRVRTSLTLLIAAAGVAATIPAVLDVYDETGPALARSVDSAARAIAIAAVVTGVVAALVALPDRHIRVSRVGGRRIGVALATVAVACACAGTVVYVSERGSPFTDIARAWNQFKTKRTPHGGTNRLGRLGSNRYDFWRVAWQRFEHAPLAGLGADNYQEAYLVHGKSGETPLYPHSVELRTLSQTGLIGAAMLVTALVAGLGAAGRAMRRRAAWGAAAAAAGVGAFVYWLVHGSVDWLWEFPALGGAAFALLGLAAGLRPRRAAGLRPSARPLAAGPARVVAVAAVGLGLALSFAGPWLADRDSVQAAQIWRARPQLALDKLDAASALNPLSPRPKILAGSIALQLGRLGLAGRYFREAIERDPHGAASHLELGAIVLNSGRRAEGLRLLARAAELQPHDRITAATLRRARRLGRVDIARMNESLRRRTAKLGR